MVAPAGNGLGDHSVATSGKFRNAFFSTETPSFTITGTAVATYEIRNYYGTIITSGTRAGAGTITLAGPLPLGWYKLYLIRGSAAASPWYTSGGELCFCVVRPDTTSPLLDRPGASQAFTSSGGDSGADIPAHGFFGIGPMRHKIPDLVTLGSAHTAAAAEITYELAQRNTDTTRPLQPLTAIPNNYGNTGGEQTNLTTSVTTCVAAGGIWFEGKNEPNITMTYTDYATEQNNFAARVHAAHASAKVMGPCTLGVGGDPASSGSQLYWLNQILPLIGANLDGISFHNYDSPQGDLPGIRRILDRFVAVLTANGQQSKPRWNTEFGSTFAAAGGDFTNVWQTKNTMLDLHIMEQYGVPKEQTYLFYDLSHGFWAYPSFWVMRENGTGQLTALAPLVRVWAEELYGKTYSARLNFGSEDNLWIGSRFTAADGSSTVALQSSGHAGTVTVTVSSGSTIDTVDPWGNITTRNVTGGVVAVPVDYLPTYVRCPTGVTVTPVAADWGVETLRSQKTTYAASSGTTTASLAADGVLDTSTGDWTAVGGFSFPVTWTATFPSTTRFNRVTVTCPAPHNATCTLIDFDVQAFISGSWTTVATATEPTPQKVWTSTNDAGGCYVDSFWSRRNQWTFRLATPVAATAVRLNIRDCSYGGGATPEAYNQNPNLGLGTELGQSGAQLPQVREVQVYLNEYDLGKVAGTPMLIH
jgi:hypothetical protein